jgi:hypothetical protein
MKVSTVFKILAVVCGLLILWQLFLHLIGVFFLACLIIGFVAIIYFVLKFAAKMLAGNKADSTAAPPVVHRIWESAGTTILYSEEPSISQLAGAQPGVKALEDKSAAVKIDNNTKVVLVADGDTHAVKIKVIEGPARGKVGWVSRGAVVKD